MSNSSLVSHVNLSPNNSGKRTHCIDRITPHCVVGQWSVETLGNIFKPTARQASSNYGIGFDGRVGMYVDEGNRSWCSSSNANDQRAVTIECASDKTAPYAMKDVVYQSLIKLCVDICKRNGKTKLLWLGDKDKSLNYEPKSNEMVITVHRWFSNTACPGDWLYARLGDLAKKVTAQLGGSTNTSTKPTKKSIDTIAQEVINGKWGNGEERKFKLEKAGYNYSEVQSTVNNKLSGNGTTPTKKSVDEIAKEVIQGKWGNGADRKNRLEKAGYNYNEVQKKVNMLLK